MLEPVFIALARRHRFPGRAIGDHVHSRLGGWVRTGEVSGYGEAQGDDTAVAEPREGFRGLQYPLQRVLTASAEERAQVEPASIGFGGAAALSKIAEVKHGIARGEVSLPGAAGDRGPIGLFTCLGRRHDVAPRNRLFHLAK